MFQMIVPQDFGYIRHSHGCTRVAGICLLHGIHTECTDGIGEFFPLSHVVLLF
jgi:hypothetical protein